MPEPPPPAFPIVYAARWGYVDGTWAPEPRITVDPTGHIRAIQTADDPAPPPGAERAPLLRDFGRAALLPGLVSAHSHGFQRSIRGHTHHRDPADPSDFWSWRDAMYAAANHLEPDAFEAATRATYREMLQSGITCVGEFHYVHHRPDGTPYDDPNELSRRVIRAATDSGIKLTLLEVYYATSAPGRPARAEQRRFVDRNVDAFLERVDELRSTGVRVGLAPHSVRAVGPEALATLAAYAARHDLPIHAHVSEQPRENRECQDAYGRTPVQVFADAGCLADPGRFTAVHAIHLAPDDVRHLAKHTVCACPTTEADLGDGIVPASDLHAAGVGLCLGSDSNATIDIVQEARLLEMNERLRRQARVCLADGAGRTLPVVIRAATEAAAASLGRPGLGALRVGAPFDACVVDLDHPSLRGVDGRHVADALFLSGTSAPIRATFVDGLELA